jgi:hypothetical protein
MSCCGQRRRELAHLTVAVSPNAVSRGYGATAVRGAHTSGVGLRYRGLGPFTQRSPRTGRLYACGGTGAALHVDEADVESLLRTRLFTRA